MPKNTEQNKYFEEYLEEKFKGLNSKLDTFINDHDTKIKDLRTDVNWAKQKIWVAIGAIGVVSVLGTYITLSFKTLNQKQIEDTLKPLEIRVQQAQNTAESTDETLQAIINNYDIRVLKQYGK